MFGQVRMWDTIIFNYLKENKLVCPAVNENEYSGGYEGAYVKILL